MNKFQEQNLRNVARALRESPDPSKFCMEAYFNGCGTPACAWGHYVARPDLNGGRYRPKRFVTSITSYTSTVGLDGLTRAYPWAVADEEFGLTEEETDELFSEEGCGWAQTPNEAADYIEAFIEDKKANTCTGCDNPKVQCDCVDEGGNE
jgi:hypothetical protein